MMFDPRSLPRGIVAALLAIIWLSTTASFGQPPATDKEVDPLAARQTGVAQRYARLEELLLRLADMEGRENPERSALLKRVARQSRERFVLEKLRQAGPSIDRGQLTKAINDQEAATEDLKGLLTLLLSEDRSSRIRDEKKRIAKLIKELRLTQRNERSVRARTENGADLEQIREEQAEIARRAEELNQQLKEDQPQDDESQSDEERSDEKQEQGKDPKESESEQSESKDAKRSDAKESDSKPSDPKDSDSKDSESKSSESKPSEAKETDSENSESKPSESQSSDSPQSSQEQQSPPSKPQTPEQQAQKQLEKAIEKMREAEKKLEDKKREGATEDQREAEEELRQAIDRLEKILRQLREEEIQRELAKLEARLKKMSVMQAAVLDKTVQLAKTPAAERSRATDLKAGDLAFEEQKITLEADRAMLLLREEGSSVAFPEVVLQLRDDTRRVATRLGESKIDAVTQGIQSDILAALEEMIAALAKAQRDLEKKQQQEQKGGPSQQGSGQEPLVQALAELKLILTMQARIQGATDRYDDLLGRESTTEEEVLPLMKNLSEREDRLYQITRDLVAERNR